MTTPIAGIFNSEKDAIAVIEELKAAGCSKEDISVLRRGSEEYEGVSGTNGTEGLAAGAAAGIVLGGAAGILATAGLLFIPGIGPLLAAGPIATVLAGAAVGGGAGSVVGGLVGLGIPEQDAEAYRALLENNRLLVFVSVEESRRSRVESIFQVYGSLSASSAAASPDGFRSIPMRNESLQGAADDMRVFISSKPSDSTLDQPAPVQEIVIPHLPSGD
ncbi:general stress protein [Paenibacillus sp. D9]|uniref:general stress protein n=1 Tax=Paenibacillus sp. D9 TaxID=665792 RepID=UPI0008411752|nr:general stress protein [Paenibacillus sp. D9]